MFKNVLVGVDGRPGGRDAIALVSQLTDPDGKLTLAHVHTGDLRPSHAIAPGLVKEEREASHKLLEQERAAADVKAQLISIVSMSPGRGLHEQAEEQSADLIVVGSCSHGALGRAMLGDDTRAALNGAACAVAIASRGYASTPPLRQGWRGIQRVAGEQGGLAARELAAPTGNGSCNGSRPDHKLRLHRVLPPAMGRASTYSKGEQSPGRGARRRGSRRAVTGESWPPSATRWTSSWSARVAMARCGAWCSRHV
jgi:nucleotide-binding universal stress UspA family protein